MLRVVMLAITSLVAATACNSSPSAPPRSVELNATATDGSLQVTPTRFHCYTGDNGNVGCSVRIDVENTGTDAVVLSEDDQKGGLEDDLALFSMNVFVENRAMESTFQAFGGDPPEVRPNEKAEVWVIFELTVEDFPKTFEFHTSEDSRGLLIERT